jgi:4,5-dihydroxyphthalate decarboxylase
MTNHNIDVPISRMRYDIMLPLLEGRVEIPSVTLKPERGPGAMVFADNPQLREGDFGLADVNLGYLPQIIENGWEVVALPVISKRKGVLQFIWARTDRGIESPKDLEGKLIGTSSFTTAITVFVRGLLQHRYDVDISKLRWKANGRDFFPNYGDIQPEYFEDRTNPVDRLINGEVDAIAADVSDGEAWRKLAASKEIKLVFPNYQDEDFAIYKEMSIFPPMHLMVMSRKLDQEHPGLARELYDAFEKSKAMACEEALNDRAGFSVLYQREIMFEQEAKWGDPFAYGYEANRRMFETYFQYNLEQGVIKAPLKHEDVFASGMLAT